MLVKGATGCHVVYWTWLAKFMGISVYSTEASPAISSWETVRYISLYVSWMHYNGVHKDTSLSPAVRITTRTAEVEAFGNPRIQRKFGRGGSFNITRGLSAYIARWLLASWQILSSINQSTIMVIIKIKVIMKIINNDHHKQRQIIFSYYQSWSQSAIINQSSSIITMHQST